MAAKKILEIFNTCMAVGGKFPKAVTATAVSTFVVSPFNVFCNYFAPESEKDPMPEYLQLLATRGDEHEEKTRNQMYPGLVPMKFATKEDGFQMFLDAGFKGVGAITNIPVFFLPENLYGEPDALEKSKSHKSIFGNYHYTVKEIKLAKNIREEQIMEAAFYNYLIGKVQGYTPETFTMINRDGEELVIPFSECAASLQEIIESVKHIMLGKVQVTPTVGRVSYPWENYGLKVAKDMKEISLIPDVGAAKKEKLAQVGIKTLDDMAKANTTKFKIKGVSEQSLNRWKLAAEAILQNKQIPLTKPVFQKVETEIFLDFEGTDFYVQEGLEIKADYLIGVLIREKGKDEYISFFADGVKDEQKIMEQFLKLLKSKNDFVIYHYSPYERTRLRAMFEKYRVNQKTSDLVLNKMVDLFPILKSSVVIPSHSYGLKEAAKILGFKWRGNIDAQDSIVLYMRYLEKKSKEDAQKIITYNEDDCKATVLIKEFLQNLPAK
jgi:predicted RecB family nuclease